MDVSWDRDDGLALLERDRGRFLHPHGQQELLVRGQLSQGLRRGRGRAGGMRAASVPQ